MRTRTAAATAALSACLLLPAAAAHADAPWSAPTDFSPGSGLVEQPTLAFSPRGDGLVGWDADAGGGVPTQPKPGNDGRAGRLLRLDRGDGFGALRSLPDTLVAGPALAADGHGLVLRSTITGADGDANRRTTVTWSTVDSAGALGAPRPLFHGTLVADPALAVDARGDALVAWTEVGPRPSRRALTGTLTLKAATKRAGDRRFSAPRTLFVTQNLDFEHLGRVSVALDDAGRGIVAYADAHNTRHAGTRTRVYAWPVARAGAVPGPRLDVGPHEGYALTAALVDARGRTTIAWGSQDGGEEADKPWVVRAASLAPGARRFGPVQVLDGGDVADYGPGAPRLAADGAGNVTVAWSALRRDPAARGHEVTPVLTATAPAATGSFGAPQQLAPDGALGGLAVRADGAAMAAWSAGVGSGPDADYEAQAAVRAPGATAFGPAETLAAPDQADAPAVAFDPVGGAPVAAWAARPNGQNPAVGGDAPTAVLRIATRASP